MKRTVWLLAALAMLAVSVAGCSPWHCERYERRSTN
jgi:hypothetical protein